MSDSVLSVTIRGKFQFNAPRANLIGFISMVDLAVLTGVTLALVAQVAHGRVVSSAFYTGTNDTLVQLSPTVVHEVNPNDPQSDVSSGEVVAYKAGDINVLLQQHHYEVAAGSYKTRNSEKLIDMAARTSHEFTMVGVDESLLWWKSESFLKAESTYNDTISFVARNPLSPQLLTAEYFFDLTASASQILDIRPGEQPLYRLSDRVRFTASGTSLVGDPINYDDMFYDIHSSDPPSSMISVLEDDVSFTGRELIPESERIQSFKIQFEPKLVIGNFNVYASNVTASIKVDSSHLFLNDGPALNFYLDGDVALKFDNSATLLGVLVHDETGAIRTDIDVSSAEGATIPLLLQPPAIVITPPPSIVILSPVAVSESGLGTFNPDVGLQNMINQSGVDMPFVSGVTSFDDYIQGLPQPTADGAFLNYWQSDLSLDGQFNGAIDFELGGEYLVDRLAIWNGTLEDIEILVADSPTGPWESVGNFTLQNQNPLLFPRTRPEILEFGDALTARYLRVQVNSAYPFLSNQAFEYAILREIAVSASAVPELGSSWLLAIGIASFLSLRKRLTPA